MTSCEENMVWKQVKRENALEHWLESLADKKKPIKEKK